MQKPMKKLGLLFVALITLSSSKCAFRPAPETELCGALDDYSPIMFCTDNRLDATEYERELLRGDVCTNVSDYNQMKAYCEALRVDLKKCKRKNR
jgi:hypothetical protein